MGTSWRDLVHLHNSDLVEILLELAFSPCFGLSLC